MGRAVLVARLAGRDLRRRPAQGVLLGIPGGYLLFSVASQGGTASQPPAWWLIVAVLDTVLVVAALTAIPARAGAQRPVAAILDG
jgi:hypothetical protein